MKDHLSEDQVRALSKVGDTSDIALLATEHRLLAEAYELGKQSGRGAKFDQEVEKTKEECLRVLSDPNLTPAGRKRALRGYRKQAAKKRREIGKANAEIAELDRNLAHEEARLVCLQSVKEWLSEPLVLQKAEGSKLHKLIQAHAGIGGTVYYSTDNGPDLAGMFRAGLDEAQSFVIGHDWAAVVGEQEAGEKHMPADWCAFEFQISGRRVIALIFTHEGVAHIALAFEHDKDWYFDADVKIEETLPALLMSQIEAVAVMLDAEVAVADVVRAPHRMNRARERRGQLPVRDYHVVNLARQRTRAPALDDATNERSSPRLHFRRGHWRHYEQHKTWVNWTLVGNPDLGFIDKEYRL